MTSPSIASFFPSLSSSSSSPSGKGEKRPFASIGGNDDDDDFDRPPVIWGRSISTSEPDYRWATADGLPTVNHAERFMAMYRTIVALGLIARFQDLYREEVRGRVNDQVNQYCYISSLQDVDHRKGVGAGIINHIRDRWDFKNQRPKRQYLDDFLRIPVEHGNLRIVWIPVDRAKVAVHWISCVRHQKLPDMTRPLWKRSVFRALYQWSVLPRGTPLLGKRSRQSIKGTHSNSLSTSVCSRWLSHWFHHLSL